MTNDSWLKRAKCREPELSPLFNKMFEDATAGTARKAKRICMDCPVNVECYNLAVANNEKWGVWGGVNFGSRDDSVIKQRTRFDMALNSRSHKRKYVKAKT